MQQSSREGTLPVIATEIGSGGMSTMSTKSWRSPVRQMLAPASSSEVDVFRTRTYEVLSCLRPNTRGDPITRVTLSMTEGKSGRATVRRRDRPCVEVDMLCGGDSRGNGNSNGVDGDCGRVGLWRMWAMSEPAGISGGEGSGGDRTSAGILGGGGSAGGRTSAWSVGGGKGGRTMSWGGI